MGSEFEISYGYQGETFYGQPLPCLLVKFVSIFLVMHVCYSFSPVTLLHHCNLLYLCILGLFIFLGYSKAPRGHDCLGGGHTFLYCLHPLLFWAFESGFGGLSFRIFVTFIDTE